MSLIILQGSVPQFCGQLSSLKKKNVFPKMCFFLLGFVQSSHGPTSFAWNFGGPLCNLPKDPLRHVKRPQWDFKAETVKVLSMLGTWRHRGASKVRPLGLFRGRVLSVDRCGVCTTWYCFDFLFSGAQDCLHWLVRSLWFSEEIWDAGFWKVINWNQTIWSNKVS